MAALLGDSDTGERVGGSKREREGEIEWGGVAKKKEKKKARGKMVVWNIC